MRNISKIISNRLFTPIVAACLGLVLFVLIYGVSVINPTNTDWLLVGGDLSQHYIGWQFYRISEWTFPLGVAGHLAYPHGLAITFMDSIPLMAIPFKIVAALLPTDFQYFGLWGLLCFMLQGSIAAVIVRNYTKQPIVILLSSLLFIISPIVLARMFGHTALAGHWIILLGVLLFIKSSVMTSNKKFILLWSLTLVLSVMIHPYFLVMNTALLLMSIVVKYASLKTAICQLLPPLLSSLVVFWCIGGFTLKTVGADRLGELGFNLNALINPMGWSAFLSDLPEGTTAGEGFNYFGLGMLIAGAIAGGYLLSRFRNKAFRVKAAKLLRSRYALVLIIILGLFVVSVSLLVQFGNTVLVEYHLPGPIEKVLSIFRATGRLFWPIYYLLFVATIATCIYMLRRKGQIVTVIFFVVIVGLQTVDILASSAVQARHRNFPNSGGFAPYDHRLTEGFWVDAAKNRKHIVYIGDLYGDDFVRVAQFAIEHNMTLNNGYFARAPIVAIKVTIDEAKSELRNEKPDPETLYVTKDQQFVDTLSRQSQIMRVSVSQDGFYAIYSSE